ncbi:MAG: hypothetical protein Q9184_005147 [Pyrenodesmia sp. 2 TL-2023]
MLLTQWDRSLRQYGRDANQALPIDVEATGFVIAIGMGISGESFARIRPGRHPTASSSVYSTGEMETDGNPTNIRPGSVTTKEQTTASTSATSTVPTADPASQTTASAPSAIVTKITTKSTTNTGAIAGGVVAGIIAAALIIVGAIWALKRRRNRPMNQKPMAVPHADTKPPLYVSEMEGSNARGELPAHTGFHELSTGGPPMKQHRTVELA